MLPENLFAQKSRIDIPLTLSIKNVDKEFWKCKGESIRWGGGGGGGGQITDEHRKAITLSTMERWGTCRFNPTLPFKGRHIVDLHFVCKQLLEACKPCKITLSLTQCQRERVIIGLAADITA